MAFPEFFLLILIVALFSFSAKIRTPRKKRALQYSSNLPPAYDQCFKSRYNKMFCFLMAVRRTQLDLQHCWSLQMYNKGVRPELGDSWQLRTHMAFLVDNLQYYLQVSSGMSGLAP